jgi:ABC-type dipeptide/oligopeptide/nickel transport system permease component
MTMTVFTHPVVRFVARRLLYSVVVLFGVLVVVFALVHLVPGDPVRIALGTRYTPTRCGRPAGWTDRSLSSSSATPPLR